jgi:uncharacterized protein (DUF1810 family)
VNADSFDLNRFVRAQETSYKQALSELARGRKQSHWMWYIFPQLDGLGSSPMSRLYAIKSEGEARAYLADPVLGARLFACAEAMLAIDGQSATAILGSPDDMKLKSCATLFAHVSGAGSVFERILEKFYAGERDGATLRLLASSRE